MAACPRPCSRCRHRKTWPPSGSFSQAPWTGWRVTEDGDRFFDQATTEELQCDGLAIYISGHRTARNMKIGSIGGQGMLIASITMSATPEGKNFQELASNLEKAVPDGAQAVLAQLQNHARWYIKQPLEGFTRELHRSNPDIRFALTFAFEQAPELVCWEQKPT
ncbi:MAG: hypothetical protein NTZ65_02845 [Candidatus Berkelbacteria bacterium]|nr:hypothetical protein [Candidatus Berkelbacteria bacterium]